MASPDQKQDGTLQLDSLGNNESIWPPTKVSQETAPNTSYGSYIGSHFHFVWGPSVHEASPSHESQGSTVIPANMQTGSESTTDLTAGNSIHIASRNLSRNDGQPEGTVRRSLREPSKISAYQHVFLASVQTGDGDSRRTQLGREQGDSHLLSSSPATYRPLRRPAKPASSCDRCRRRKIKCSGQREPDACDQCKRFASSRSNSGGEVICTYNLKEKSNQRHYWT
jgi:hypothetical protein